MEKIIYKDKDSIIKIFINNGGIVLNQTGIINDEKYSHDIITDKNGLKSIKEFFKNLD